ncbi:MAG: acetylglutamate kinase [Candidatus Magnetoovum sp. WYHC-5]|nr:acetylglutamate kinase [Candidatus Magnetoovum sp. WYHC-5]
MEKLLQKAEVLIEALPYIRNFYKRTFVIKYGGAAQVSEQLTEAFAKDIVLFNYVGINTVIVHGGGPRISKIMERLGKIPQFIDGQRVTDAETMEIAEMVLCGSINKEIVMLLHRYGGKAVGLSGKDGGLIEAKKRQGTVDLGYVGEVDNVNPVILTSLDEKGFIPVIAPIGFNQLGETFNINADAVAGAVAGAIKAEKLILLTDVPGVLDEHGKVISTIRKNEVRSLIDKKVISGGMLPKIKACLSALEGGVNKTHIVDGRIPNCLLLEIFTQKGIGTEIIL